MELLVIRHTDFTLTVECDNYLNIYNKALRNMCSKEKLLSYYRWTDGVESVTLDGNPIENGSHAKALFFDNADYPVWVDFNINVTSAEFDNSQRSVANNFHYHPQKKVLSGFVNYGNEIGRSEINIRYTTSEGVRHFTLFYEVLSTKLDYHEHWKTIVEDVEKEYNMLALDFLKKTYHGFSNDTDAPTQDLIWWNVFSSVQQKFIRACKTILDRPHNRLRSNKQFLRADRIKHLGPQLENDVANHRKEPNRLYQVDEYILNNNTPENQFFKFALRQIYKKYDSLLKRVETVDNLNPNKKAELNSIGTQMKHFVNHPFFRNVTEFKGLRQISLLLQNGQGYSDIYRSWIILRQGYSLNEGLFKLETKDIATLYEIWCFIKVKDIVQQLTGAQADNRSRTEMNGVFSYELVKGEQGRVLFEKDGVELAELVYNPKHDNDENDDISIADLHSETVPQKPDIVLQLTKKCKGSALKFTYLFDAKYRIDKKEMSGVDLPPADAINQMHRYRDAIYYSNQGYDNAELKKEIIGGYILFPGDGDPLMVQTGKFQQSIEKVNIGAFPLRPNDTENIQLLIEFIKKLLEKDSVQLLAQENIIPQKGLYYDNDKPKEALVYVGIVKNDNPYIEELSDGTADLYYSGTQGLDANVDIQAIKYLMPIIKGKISGVYEVLAIKSMRKSEISANPETDADGHPVNDGVRHKMVLGEYTKFGAPVPTSYHLHNGETFPFEAAKQRYDSFKEA